MEKKAVPFQKIIFVCTNQRAPGERKCCNDGGGAALRDTLKQLVKDRGLRKKIRVSQSGCLDRCESGPNIMVFPDQVWYSGVTELDLETILAEIIASLPPDAE